MYMYIYIYRERERDRERERESVVALEPSPWRRIQGDHAGKARGGAAPPVGGTQHQGCDSTRRGFVPKREGGKRRPSRSRDQDKP